MRIAPGEAQRNPGFATKMTFASCRDALNRRTQLAHCELVCPTAGVLPIITRKKRTIETVKNGARNFHELDPIRTGQSRQKQPTPPYPPWGFYENKALSRFSVLHAKKTKKLQTPKCWKTAILHHSEGKFVGLPCCFLLRRATSRWPRPS